MLNVKAGAALVVPAFFLCCLAAPARAFDVHKLEYLLEVGQGVAIPIGGDTYTRLGDPSYDARLGFALGIPVTGGLRLGPALQLHGSPVNTDDAAFENVGLDARLGRVRFLVGVDARYRFADRVDVFLRFTAGVDHVTGDVRFKLLGNLSGSYGSSVFGFEPSVGAVVRVWRGLVVGLELAFPFAVNHRFGGGNAFNVADARLGVLGGWRF